MPETTEKPRPPKYPFLIFKTDTAAGKDNASKPINPKEGYRTKAKAQEAADFLNSIESSGYTIDRAPYVEGMLIIDDE